jgi:predicted DNA-binding transcriptional regulator YafY
MPVRVKIRFSRKISGYISEKIWHESQCIEHLPDGSVLFTAEVAGTDEIKFWILSWGAQAEVLAPEGLRDEIRSEAEAMRDRYGGRDERPTSNTRLPEPSEFAG